MTTRENYTVGSSIFASYTLGYSIDFLTFILQGPQFCKNYTLGLSTEWDIFYTLGLVVRPNVLTPVTFYWKSPLGIYDFYLSITAVCNKLFALFRHKFNESDNYVDGRHTRGG